MSERLCLIVPCKDEELGLSSLFGRLDALADEFAGAVALEFVFVDDGSTDTTWRLLQERAAARVDTRVCRHERNRGLAAAIATGMAVTDAELCASIDADLSYDPAELLPMARLLGSSGADVVTASPYHPAGRVVGVPPWRLLLSRGLSCCYRLLLRSGLRTWTSCCRVYRRPFVAGIELANPGFLGTAELLVRVLRRGGRVAEHPCTLGVRRFGASKMKIARTVGQHLRLLLRVALGRVS
ncbi:MAG: glycosyltransferase family 2 protein [Planctomycetota bacterium]